MRGVLEVEGSAEPGKACGLSAGSPENGTVRPEEVTEVTFSSEMEVKSQGMMEGEIIGFGTSSTAWSAHAAVKIKVTTLTRR